MSNLKLVPYTNSKGLLAVRAEVPSSEIDLSQLILSPTDVKQGVTYLKSDGTFGTGTLPIQTGTITLTSTSTTLPEGYYNGNTVTLGNTDLANLIAANIKAGVPILGVTGSYTGEMITAYVSKDSSSSIRRTLTFKHDLGVKPKRWNLSNTQGLVTMGSDYGLSSTQYPLLTFEGSFSENDIPTGVVMYCPKSNQVERTKINEVDYSTCGVTITADATNFTVTFTQSSYSTELERLIFGKGMAYGLRVYG